MLLLAVFIQIKNVSSPYDGDVATTRNGHNRGLSHNQGGSIISEEGCVFFKWNCINSERTFVVSGLDFVISILVCVMSEWDCIVSVRTGSIPVGAVSISCGPC